jgi:hypothetical protein
MKSTRNASIRTVPAAVPLLFHSFEAVAAPRPTKYRRTAGAYQREGGFAGWERLDHRGAGAVPSLRQRSRLAPPETEKYSAPFTTTGCVGLTAELGYNLSTRTVPAAVPSDFQSSPDTAKYSVPLSRVRLVISELPGPG